MRRLLPTGAELSDDDLIELYAGTATDPSLVRLNMAATVDGSATGDDNRAGSINTPPDNRVFQLLRAWADVIVAGSGTVLAEHYDAAVTDPRWTKLREGRPADPALAVLTSSGTVPSEVDTSTGGEVLGVRSSAARPFSEVIDQLHEKGYRRILFEGGPTIAGEALAQGVIDELCLTWTPMVVGGDGPRITRGPQMDRPLTLLSMLEEDGTLIGRWQVG
ncbi:pyrimidine reductase family protein [Flexivirga sp. ID2601S]|uniref:Pyrimidine reductase family protein n=1 Tax=Flexivirga aerilata TaxID=1656889 RepID=A0A849AGG0_9MICO|nr:dihydrofolate reductase family protein [Flexivirga aerilata]NNG39924.1 pyrimidine reductase family protein [Flexivirga aerilata]